MSQVKNQIKELRGQADGMVQFSIEHFKQVPSSWTIWYEEGYVADQVIPVLVTVWKEIKGENLK